MLSFKSLHPIARFVNISTCIRESDLSCVQLFSYYYGFLYDVLLSDTLHYAAYTRRILRRTSSNGLRFHPPSSVELTVWINSQTISECFFTGLVCNWSIRLYFFVRILKDLNIFWMVFLELIELIYRKQTLTFICNTSAQLIIGLNFFCPTRVRALLTCSCSLIRYTLTKHV